MRFSYYVSHSRIKSTERPVVDEWFCYLFDTFEEHLQKRYNVNLTHDIDTLYRYDRSNTENITYLRDLLRFKEIFYLIKNK